MTDLQPTDPTPEWTGPLPIREEGSLGRTQAIPAEPQRPPTDTQPLLLAATAVQNLDREAPDPPASVPPPLPPAPTKASPAWMWFAGGAALVGLGLAALWLAGDGTPSPRPRPLEQAEPTLETSASDAPAALQPYLERARRGDTKAMRLLGAAYTYGTHGKVDRAEGLKWYRKAAEAGDRTAQEELRQIGGGSPQ